MPGANLLRLLSFAGGALKQLLWVRSEDLLGKTNNLFMRNLGKDLTDGLGPHTALAAWEPPVSGAY